VIEGAGDHRDKIMCSRDLPKPMPDGKQFPWLERLIPASAAWQFHGYISDTNLDIKQREGGAKSRSKAAAVVDPSVQQVSTISDVRYQPGK
jgi:hypothetical protein